MLPLLAAIVVVAGAAAAPAAALGATHIVWGWGKNEGQLGDGTEGNVRALPVPSEQGVVGVSAGDLFSLALMEDGTITAWGYNGQGQLGDGTTTESKVPVPVSGLSGVTAIAAGWSDGLALRGDGTVWAWGSNDHGELGDGTTISHSVPVQVIGLSGVTAIAAGRADSLALLKDGTVMAWGYNWSGQLGDGTTADSSVPIAVHGLSGVSAISAGNSYALALLGDGTVMAWGDNELGELGNGTTTTSTLPVAVSGLTGVTHIAAGEGHSLATLGDGTGAAWGRNDQGQLGDGTNTGPEQCGRGPVIPCSTTPVPVLGLTGATAVAAGFQNSLALVSDGNVMAWGRNSDGELGIGTTTGPQQCFGSACSLTPVGVHRLGAVGGIAAGPDLHYLAYRTHPAAHPPDYGLCVKVLAGRGRFDDAGCSTPGGRQRYEWFPGVGLARFRTTHTTGTVTLTTVTGARVVCLGENGTGEYRGADEVANVRLRLTGCKHSTTACTSPGSGEGELVTSALLGVLGVEALAEEPRGNRIGLDLFPTLGMTRPFLEFSCGSTAVVVRGSLIAPVVSDGMRLQGPLTYTQHAGRQQPEGFAEEPRDVLESSWGGGPWEQAGLQMRTRQANEEHLEVNAVS